MQGKQDALHDVVDVLRLEEWHPPPDRIRLVRPVTAIDGAPVPQSGPEQVRIVFAKLCEEIAGESGELDLFSL